MILVFGATGKIGGATARALKEKHIPFRVFVRDPADAARFRQQGIDATIGDIRDKASVDSALQGVDKLLFVSPLSSNMAQEFSTVLQSAKEAGITHFVRSSALGAEPDAPVQVLRWHGESDRLLQNSGLNWTVLKPTFFMQNFLGQAGSIKTNGAIYAPAGAGKAAFIDVQDIGNAAAKVLAAPEADGGKFTGKSYDLTGPELLSHKQVADKISLAIGQPVQYLSPSPEDATKALTTQGLLRPEAEAVTELMTDMLAKNNVARISSGVRQLTGKPPQNFDNFIARNISTFAPSETSASGYA